MPLLAGGGRRAREPAGQLKRRAGAEIHPAFTGKEAARPRRLPGILGLNPTYRSLFIQYDPWECSFENLLLVIDECLEWSAEVAMEAAPPIEIPVCYGGSHGPDLDEVIKGFATVAKATCAVKNQGEVQAYEIVSGLRGSRRVAR